jgi:hypothetical protein
MIGELWCWFFEFLCLNLQVDLRDKPALENVFAETKYDYHFDFDFFFVDLIVFLCMLLELY